MLVTELLKQNAERYPDQEAMVEVNSDGLMPFDDAAYTARRRSITWSEFNDISNQVANYYRSIGIGPGHKVVILLMNCLEWLPLYFGILKSGAVAVPMNFRYQTEDIVRNVRLVDADAMVFGAHCRAAVENGSSQLTEINSFIYLGCEGDCPPFAKPWQETFACSDIAEFPTILRPEDDAAIYFSSGTTGAPKAVVYTHNTLTDAYQLEHGNHHQVHEDIFICIPPLYHVGAKLHWMGNLAVGGSCVMLLGFKVPAFFEAMRREGVSIAFLLLPWVQDILFALDHGELDLKNYQFPHWRMLHMGAQPIPATVVQRIAHYFPDLAYEISYGLTESGGPGCLNLPHDRMDKLGSVGLPAVGWEARVVNVQTGSPVSTGEPGELLLRGGHMMDRYYKDPVSTAVVLVDGWLHTGDIAKVDQDGFYYIVGRMKDIIISGGENIYPVQIEDFLRTHSEVHDAAVFGVCDCRLGEAVVALVELEDHADCTAEELMLFCQRLPKFQRPRQIYLGAVPRNATGKIDKKALRKQYSNKHLFTSHTHP